MPQAMCDFISSIGIGIGIGAAAADSIGYWAPARYRSNPTLNMCICTRTLHKHRVSYAYINCKNRYPI